MARILGACLAWALAVTALAAAQNTAAQNTNVQRDDTRAGVYSAAQAERGQAAYDRYCARCHRADLGGLNARPLTGPAFFDRWREFTLDLLFNALRANMPPPQARPREGITDQEYLDIMTFLLKGNGQPAGSRDLALDQLGAFTLVGADGPQLSPSSSIVHVVACFRQISDNRWGLAEASHPVRTLLEQITDEERNRAATWTTGDGYYRLQSLDIVPDFIPEEHLDARVHAKGYLILQPGQERINLIALEVLADDCKAPPQ